MNRTLFLFSLVLLSFFIAACSASNPCVFSLESASTNLVNSSGFLGLDPDFGEDGRQWTSFGTPTAVEKMFLMADGRILAAGFNEHYVFLARYTTSGDLDVTFGSGGKISYPVSFTAGGVSFQSNGKLIVAGITEANGNASLSAIRMTTEGLQDFTFASGGTAAATFSQSPTFRFNALALRNDDTINIIGTATSTYQITIPNFNYKFPISTTTEVAIFRISADGQPDASFGTNGQVYRQGSLAITLLNNVNAAVAASDGTLILAGDAFDIDGQQFSLIRLKANGDLDTGFGVATRAKAVVKDAHTEAFSVAVTATGKIIAAGRVTSGVSTSALTVRFDQSGLLDSTFGTQGLVIEANTAGNVSAQTISDVQGLVLVGGYRELMVSLPSIDTRVCSSLTITVPHYVFSLFRYRGDGSRDSDFGKKGELKFDFSGANARVHTILQTSIHDPYLVGGDADSSFGLARILPY